MYANSIEKDDVEKELDNLFSVLSQDIPPSTDDSQAISQIDPDIYRWQQVVPRIIDKIGDFHIDISSPVERGWHSCTKINNRYLLVFGGFSFKGHHIPQSYTHTQLLPSDMKFHSDLCIYDTLDMCWFKPKLSIHPKGRYGHVSVALDKVNLLIFGGRATAGIYLNDTWIYNIESHSWKQVDPDNLTSCPCARAFSSSAAGNGKIFLHGGTDGYDNFGDFWSFSQGLTGKDQWHWQREVLGGLGPSPRYGHTMLHLSGSDNFILLGGCACSPQSETNERNGREVYLSSFQDIGRNHQVELNVPVSTSSTLGAPINYGTSVVDDLQDTYRQENVFIHEQAHRTAAGTGHSLFGSHRNGQTTPYLDKVLHLLHQSAIDTGAVHALERETREKEIQVASVWKQELVNRHKRKTRARHPFPNIEVYIVNVRDASWSSRKCRGKIPVARMHFGAFFLDSYVILFGGTHPTSLCNRPVDESSDDKDGKPNSHVHILDIRSMRWTNLVPPRDTAREMDAPLAIAHSDIIRAERRLESEKNKGFMLGTVVLNTLG
jgi:hypothetical protein